MTHRAIPCDSLLLFKEHFCMASTQGLYPEYFITTQAPIIQMVTGLRSGAEF